MKLNTLQLTQNRRILISFICAISATLFLFYIDEGYYNFNWMLRPGNWIPFLIYTCLLLGFQLFISEVLLGACNGRVKTFATLLMSVMMVILLMLAFSK